MQFSTKRGPGKRRSPARRYEEVKMLGVTERKKLAAAILAEGLIRLLSREEDSPKEGSAPGKSKERKVSHQNHDDAGAAGENAGDQ